MCIYVYYVRKRIVWREREREILKYLKSIIFFFIKNNEYIYFRIRKYFSCCNKYV